MITQREYVEGCLQWYEEADLQPGNPEDGEWHECHYPTPKCLGGTETVLLLKEHHAVQGVLQSNEYQHPCIWGWEKEFIPAIYLNLYRYWRSEQSRRAVAVTNDVQKEVRVARATHASQYALCKYTQLTEEEKSERGRRASLAKPTKSIILVTPSGQEIQYKSITEACRFHDLVISCIHRVCNGTRKTHKGYTARYAG
jgi:hypothetical protein